MNFVLTEDSTKKRLDSLSVIPCGGKYKNIEVTAVTEIVDSKGRDKKIFNFKAITPFKAKQADGLFNEGKYQEALNCAMSTDYLLPSEGRFHPAKGDIVTLIVEDVPVKDKEGETFPCIKRVVEQEATVARSAASLFSSFQAKEEAEETLDDVVNKG